VRASAALLLTTFLLGCGERSPEDKLCDTVTAIAADPQKTEYVKEWVLAHRDNEKFVAMISHYITIEMGEGWLRELGGFDWKRLGFEEGVAKLQINMGPTYSGPNDFDDIKSVSIELGANSVVIRIGPTQDLGLTVPPEFVAKLEPVQDGVFVMCERDLNRRISD